MKKEILCTLFLISAIWNVNAQDELEPINTGGANFLTITPDARSAGMGGTGVTLAGNDNAIFYNAATTLLNDERTGGVTYTYIPWMRDSESGYSLNTAGGFYKIDKKNVLLAGFRYYKYPKMGLMAEEAEDAGSIHPKELSIDIGYAREITQNLAISGTFRYIRSDMGSFENAKKANAVAFDAGALYKRNINITGTRDAGWAVGFQFSNIGSKIKYQDSKEYLPMMAKLGGSVDLAFSRTHKLSVATDLGYRLVPSDVTSFNAGAGAEYTLAEHFMFRGGYHYGDKNKGDASYATAGLGINFGGAHLDFSWLFAESDNPWKNTFRISAGYSF